MRTNAKKAIAAFLVFAACALDASAQAPKWPARPVRIVVPFSVGSGSDLTTRILGERLAARWGQSVVVDNRPGGAGIPGMIEFRKSPADGHDFLMGSNGDLSTNPHVYPNLPYDVERDFEPVIYAFRVPFVIFVSAAGELRTLRDLVAAARANPGRLSYASSGTGSPMHLGMEMFNMPPGIEMLHVPFKGAGQILGTVASGEVTAMMLSYNTPKPMVDAGKLRALAVMSNTRIAQRPDLPTAAEAGFPFTYAAWGTIIALKGIAPPILDRVNADINEVLKMPEVRERFENGGFEITGGTPAQAAELIRTESARMRAVVQKVGIKPGQ